MGEIQSAATLAAVDLGRRAEFLADFLSGEKPAFQVARADLSLRISFVAGAHASDPLLYLGSIGKRSNEGRWRNRMIRRGVFWTWHCRLGLTRTFANSSQLS